VRRYAAILRRPYVTPLVAAMVLSRLPIGINALAIVLYLSAERGSYAVAGAVAGSLAAGACVGAPIRGRQVDRRGQRAVLVPASLLHAAALGALVAFTEAGLPAVLLAACGLVAGLATPPTSSVLRSMWPRLIGEDAPGELQAAYALDTVLIELVFIAGPLLTGAIAAVASPAAALGVSAVAVVAGTLAFTALPPSRAVGPSPRRADAHWLGALASPGVRTLVLTSLPAGVGIGIVEVGLPAFSEDQGAAAAAGALLALWSLGSLVGGLVYGALRNRPPLGRVHLAVASLLPLSLLPLAAAPSVAAMGLLVLPAGAFIAPLLATRNELVGGVAPPGTLTEAYTWPVTALVGGIAVGSALAGAIVEAEGWRIAFLTAGAVAALGAALAIARRRSIAPYPV
jgi:MFS family permease